MLKIDKIIKDFLDGTITMQQAITQLDDHARVIILN